MYNYLRVQKSVVIDAGHGGDDPGAVNGKIYEKDFNLTVSKYIFDRLKELGIPVYLTRNSDETLNRDERVKRILNAFGNNSNVIVLSNHINAGGGEGAEVVYALRNRDTLAKSILEEIGNKGQIMRKYYQRRLPEDPSKDYFFIQRLTGNTEPLLIEYGFIDNSNDLKKLQNNLLDYGEAVVKAIANYLGIVYSSPIDIVDNVYIVKKGDSLYSIAQKYNVTVQELIDENNLTTNLLSIGQRIKIPIKTPEIIEKQDYVVYVVKKGDSLYSIAKKFNTTVDRIIYYNNLNSNNLSINQQLLIPISEEEENIDINPENPNLDDNNYYVVQKGDTLYSIARNNNLNVNDIISLNNLTSTILQVGQRLLLKQAEDNMYYIVKKGDTLYNIAKKFNTTVDEIKRVNNLTTNLLSINQQLIIP